MGTPRSFGFKSAWLAARTDSVDDVMNAIQAQEAEPCSWEHGIDAVHAADPSSDDLVFVTPSLDGWILAVSPAFFNEASDVDHQRLGRFVTDLSSTLGTEVQFFFTHRVVEGHGWAKADAGTLVRAFFYLGELGEVLVHDGVPTPGEEPLISQMEGAGREPDEGSVMEVARSWSIDPTEIEERYPDVADGYLGLIRSWMSSAQPTSEPESRRPWWKFWRWGAA